MTKNTKRTNNKANGQDTIYKMVSEKLIKAIEDAINEGKQLPWSKPWNKGKVGGAISYATKQPYDLVNQFMLGFTGVWVSWTEIQKQGASLKKGSKASYVVERFRAERVDEKVNEDTGEVEEVKRQWWKLRYFKVFNIEDVEGIKPLTIKDPETNHADPIAEGELIVTDYESRETLRIYRDTPSDRAYYSPVMDEIHVPSIKQFKKAKRAEYYSTLFHEMAHSTGHESRLDRFKGDAKNAAFGSTEYSQEELVAEMSAAMLLATTGIETKDSFKNSVAYLRGWLKPLKDDVKLAYWACRQAEKAVSYILYGKDGYKEPTEDEPTEEVKAEPKTEDKPKKSTKKTTKAEGKKTATKTKTAKTKAEGEKPSPKVEDEPKAEAKTTPFKAEYKISTSKGLKPLEGYVFSTGYHKFGVTNNYYNHFGKVCKGDFWTVTELRTGCSTAITANTRKAAIDKLLKRLADKDYYLALTKHIKNYLEGGSEDINAEINPTKVMASAY